MDAAPAPPASATSPAPAAPPPPIPSEVVTAWPRSAQLAMAFVLGLAAALLAVHVYASLRHGTRPTELERAAVVAHRVDLNRAGRAELLQVPGVGESLAARIENHRRQRGGFRSVDELRQIHGVGPATLERLRPWFCVQAEE